MSKSDRIVIGRDLPAVPDLRAALDESLDQSFEFVVTPLVHPRFERNLGPHSASEYTRLLPWTRSDLLLQSSEWTSCVVGRLSDWNVLSTSDEEARKNARAVFKQEVGWASHLALPAVLAKCPDTLSGCTELANLITSNLQQANRAQFWVQVPLVHHRVLMRSFQSDSEVSDAVLTKDDDTWEIWNRLRLLCHHHAKNYVCLEITEDLPTQDELNRWLGEQIRAVIIPTRIFQAGNRGIPQLSKVHEEFLFKLFRLRGIQYIISGNSTMEGGDMAPYHFALLQVHRAAPKLTQQQIYEQSYWDVLQMPLQPLMDNLESSTYETFEYDNAKYLAYEEAIFRALQDKFAEHEAISRQATAAIKMEGTTAEEEVPVAGAPEFVPVVMVVGAGRGGIVEAAMRAETRIGKRIVLYALDKNPHALITMRTKQQFDARWAEVKIVHSDMRAWQPTELCDILVSEMLGSFGDNELSPECLQGAERFMKPDTGVSIPRWYKAFVAPLMSPKLYNAVAAMGQPSHFETAYVVRLHNIYLMAPEPKECWIFEHPDPQNKANCDRQRQMGFVPPSALDPIDNSRSCELTFRCPVSALLHGFAGYFDCCLYGDVHVSIHPDNHTQAMSSWFEIYFPIRDPMYVPADTDITVNFWRLCSPQKVWYEWCVSSPQPTPIHNPNGRSYWVGL